MTCTDQQVEILMKERKKYSQEPDPLLHQPERGQPGTQAEVAGGAQDQGRLGHRTARTEPGANRTAPAHRRSGPDSQEPSRDPKGSGSVRDLPQEAQRAGEGNRRADREGEDRNRGHTCMPRAATINRNKYPKWELSRK